MQLNTDPGTNPQVEIAAERARVEQMIADAEPAEADFALARDLLEAMPDLEACRQILKAAYPELEAEL